MELQQDKFSTNDLPNTSERERVKIVGSQRDTWIGSLGPNGAVYCTGKPNSLV